MFVYICIYIFIYVHICIYRSSVTAGHDNYFKEAYPHVFEEAFRPIFEFMGNYIDVYIYVYNYIDVYMYTVYCICPCFVVLSFDLH
jgi:hypothetical protein